MELNKYSVYAHINKYNGKVYIGITGMNPSKRWGAGYNYIGCTLFKRAIDKYKWDGFHHVILYNNLDRNIACKVEAELIKEYKELGISYNITEGGTSTKGHLMSKSARLKIGAFNKGKYVSEHTRKKIRESKLGIKLSPLSFNHKLKISEALKGRVPKNIPMFCKRTIQLDINNNIVMIWDSTTDAARNIGGDKSFISKVCRNGGTAYGYKWKYDTSK